MSIKFFQPTDKSFFGQCSAQNGYSTNLIGHLYGEPEKGIDC